MQFAQLALLATLTASVAGAQVRDTVIKPLPPWKPPATLLDTTASPRANSAPRQQQSFDRRDPTTAGWLSFLWPGVGSFYAGANGHGWAHLGVSLAAVYGVAMGAASKCVPTRFENCQSANAQTNAIVGSALGVALVNQIWSIFTAASDARTHNDANGLALQAAPRGLAVAWRF